MYGNTTINAASLANPPLATGGDVITVKITFNDGSTISLKSVVQFGEELTTAHRMNELLNANMLAFEVDGHTMLFPTTSVRFMEIFPALKTPSLLIGSSFTLG